MDNKSKSEELQQLDNFLQTTKENENVGTQIKLIENSCNDGYARANNLAIMHSKGQIVILLNSDVFFSRDFLQKINVFISRHPIYSIYGVKINYYSNKEKTWALGGKIDFKHPLICNIICADKYNCHKNRPFKVDMIPGCCLIVKRTVFQQIGLLDPNYFMYWEDTDFCYRAKQAGFHLIINPDILLYHDVDEENKTFSKFITGKIFRNRIYFALKNGNYIEKLSQILFFPIFFLIYLYNFKFRKFDRYFFHKLKESIIGITLSLKMH